jgi:hypothetical protein
MRDEFLKRRRFGDWETFAGGSEQEAEARFPVSGSPSGSIRRDSGLLIVTRFSSAMFLNCLGQVPRKVIQSQESRLSIKES